MPSFRAFEIFIAVAYDSSISRAAQRLHLTQPAVSHQLAGLEKEVGVTLLDRGARGVTLTREGRAFLDHARSAVDAASKAVASARAGATSAAIRIAVAESFTLPFIVPVLGVWNAEGRTPLELVETSSASSVIDSLRRGDHDLAVVPGPLPTRGLHVQVLGTEDIVAVAATSTSVITAAAHPLTLVDAADTPLIGVIDSNGYSGWIADRFAEAGIAPRSAMLTRSVQTAAALAAAGFGTAIVPRSALGAGMPSASFTPPLQREILAVTRSTPQAALAELIESIRRRVSDTTRL